MPPSTIRQKELQRAVVRLTMTVLLQNLYEMARNGLDLVQELQEGLMSKKGLTGQFFPGVGPEFRFASWEAACD